METIYAICVGAMTTGGIFLVLRGYTFAVVLGLTLLSYAVNLFLFASGNLKINAAAILGESEQYADPLPQALVLTAIVISFGMTAVVVMIALGAYLGNKDDHVDEPLTDTKAEDRT